MPNEILKFIPEQLMEDDFRFLKIRPKGKEPTGDSLKWQERNFSYLDEEFINHVINGGNYGIIGGYGNLIIIDSDSPRVSKIAETLPRTFTVKTGSQEEYKKHYFFIADKKVKPIRLTGEKAGDMGDVRSVGQYVVGCGSLHPKGGEYKVLHDIPISKINEEEIRLAFKEFIDPSSSTEFKEYPIDTTLRNSRFIRECKIPDYVANNKLESGGSKNWELFPAIVDILYNRRARQEVYETIVKTQGHSQGAIKGWVKKAYEGKLAKTSCKKLREYMKGTYSNAFDNTCMRCPMYKKIKELKKIKESPNYSLLQKEVLMALAIKNKDKATELVVEEFKKDNYIYTTKDDIKTEMWIYREGIYIPQGKSTLKEFSRKILGEAFTTQLSNNIISKIEADTFIEHEDFFNTNYIYEIPLLNGILNISTRELSDFEPTKIFFNKLPVNYDPSAECEKIIKHFRTILKTESDVKVLIELFGFLLLKEYRLEKAFMFVGDGRNGKSKTIELIKKFLGANNCSSLPLKLLHEESFSLNELFGKMANLAADLSKTDLKETGTIKSLIGRDTIQSKRKFLRDLTFVNHAKMIFAANELPRIYDTTDGFWTKWILLEFPYKFISQKDYDNLKEKDKLNFRVIDPEIVSSITTPEELSGLLNLALDGLLNLLENKDFSYSKSINEVKDMWIRKSDSFVAFCYDHLEEDIESNISKKKLREYYFKYRKKHKLPGCSDKSMKITLDNVFGSTEDYRDYSSGERFWTGIKMVKIDELK